MAIDSAEVVVGGNGSVSVAPAGTTVPTGVAALSASYINVGYISEDGVTFTGGADIEDINAWQSFYPLRKIITARNAAVEFIMRQWNGENLKLAFGGGQIVNAAGTTYYRPPDPSEQDTRVMVVDWQDGNEKYRLVVPRGLVSGETTTEMTRSAASDLPISFAVTPNTTALTLTTPTTAELATQPWYFVTDASSFVT